MRRCFYEHEEIVNIVNEYTVACCKFDLQTEKITKKRIITWLLKSSSHTYVIENFEYLVWQDRTLSVTVTWSFHSLKGWD